jgi:hypothetical protein
VTGRLADGAELRVVDGAATTEEAVAVLLAVDQARRADAAPAGPPEPGWRRAARLEAIARIRFGALHELRAASRRPGRRR